jgi:hypothetical protein
MVGGMDKFQIVNVSVMKIYVPTDNRVYTDWLWNGFVEQEDILNVFEGLTVIC